MDELFRGPRFDFPKSSRLKSPRYIRRVFREGSRITAEGFTVHWIKPTVNGHARGDNQHVRMAFVVSRRSGKAHQRNRIKRRMREAARLNRKRWPEQGAIVFRALNHRLAKLPFADLMRAFRESFQRIASPQP